MRFPVYRTKNQSSAGGGKLVTPKSIAMVIALPALILIAGVECRSPQTIPSDVDHYAGENGFIVGRNIDRYNNRPLYINNTNAFVLAGDKPLVRLAHGETYLGAFVAGLVRDGKGKWLQQCSSITSMYRSGQMIWKISDATLSGLTVTLDVLPMAGTVGFAVKMSIDGVRKGDSLVWAYGGGKRFHRGEQRDLNWYYDASANSNMLTWGFTPDECRNTTVKTAGNGFTITAADSAPGSNGEIGVRGYSSLQSTIGVGEASLWNDLSRFAASQPETMPIIKGIAELENKVEMYWAVEEFTGSSSNGGKQVSNPAQAYADGAGRVQKFLERLKIQTPDSSLNALAPSVAAALDGRWYPPYFVHGPMSWNIPYVGWRTTFGPINLGWHDRVQAQARYYIGYQVTRSNKKEAKADSKLLLTVQDAASRFNGVGSIQKDQEVHTYTGNTYNMQTQFFDQMIEEWRFTGDPNFEKLLRPALELQLKWEEECFDPDGDGVYESYINTWPTDCQWYNGGGTAEETAYAYRAHAAARDMARRAKDPASVAYHESMLEKIKKGFFTKLWIYGKGHSGAYREQGGHERLHEDPWLYSIFLPIDAQLTSSLQALESVYYSEWALQNDRLPLGGRMVWNSNWLPSQWSVRERYPGDNNALALSYFQAGLPDDGWDILRGTFLSNAFAEAVPGNLGTSVGGLDFGDCTDMFVRALVQGMFGYNPDYPNGLVKILPQFPSEWNQAFLELPDVKISFNRDKASTNLTVHLAKAARIDMAIPVGAREVRAVSVNGNPIQGWELLPGAGCTLVRLRLPDIGEATIGIETGDPLPRYTPLKLEGNVGDAIELVASDAKITSFEDPQNVLENASLSDGVIRATLSKNKGFHTVVATVLADKTPQWRVFRIRVNDPQGDARERTIL